MEFFKKKYLSTILFLFSSTFAFSFTLNTQGSSLKGWGQSELIIDYNWTNCSEKYSSEALLSVLDSAIQIWNEIPLSSLRLVRGIAVSTTSSEAVRDSTPVHPLIACDAGFSSAGGTADQIPADTFIQIDSSNQNTIIHGVIVLNSKKDKLASIDQIGDSKLKVVLGHEMGHLLGLGHTSDQAALMYYDLSSKEKLALTQDDKDGIAYLYPRKELFGNSPPMGCGTTNRTQSNGIYEILFLFIALYLYTHLSTHLYKNQ